MRPSRLEPTHRRRRFAAVRHLTQSVFFGSGIASALLVGYVAHAASTTTTLAPATPGTSPGTDTTTTTLGGAATSATSTTVPTTSRTVRGSTPPSRQGAPTVPTTAVSPASAPTSPAATSTTLESGRHDGAAGRDTHHRPHHGAPAHDAADARDDGADHDLDGVHDVALGQDRLSLKP